MVVLAAVMMIAYVAQWFFHGETQVGIWWVAFMCALFGLRHSLSAKFFNQQGEKNDE